MINSLEQRLALRKVDVRTGVRVTGLSADARTVRTDHGDLSVDAVIAGCDPDQLYHRLLPRTVLRAERRRLDRLPAALAPQITLSWADREQQQVDGPTETVEHTPSGPRICYTRPAGERTVRIVHDYSVARPDPSAGVGWNRARSWLNRPPVSTGIPALFTAGPFSAAGPAPSMQVLSGALAAYACQRLVAPHRPLEPR